MKTKQLILTALVILTGVGTGASRAATNEVSALLQKGLFEEEANHNLEAAIQAYQAVVTQTEKDRQFAATAIFRLGECYRKLGRTNEANAQYQRILKEFPDQPELAKLSQSYVGSPAATASAPVAVQMLLQDIPGDSPETTELKRIQALIKDSPDLINGQDGRNIPLVTAAEANYLTVAKYLLDHKADVNAQSGLAVKAAVQSEHKEMVELLADRGADLNSTAGPLNDAPLYLAARAGNKAIAEVLLAHKADPNIKDGRTGDTPLHQAARSGFLSFAELLLANGANVDAPAEDGQTPLHSAARADNRAIIELLLAHKADVNARARDGETPLLAAAAETTKFNAARALLEHGANVNAAITGSGNYRGWMPLHWAVYHDQPEMVKLLLENKAEVNARVPIYPAANRFGGGGGGGGGGGSGGGFGGPRPIPQFNQSYGDITPLGMAVIDGGGIKTAQLLLDHQADVNAPDRNSDTPLSLAVKLQRLDMMELLLAHGATVQSLNNDHLSPLGLAVQANSPDTVKLLLAHKPDLEVVDNYEATPLQSAIFQTDGLTIAEMLLDAGAKTEVRYTHDYRNRLPNPNGVGLLFVATIYENKEMVALLLAHHANPNFQDFSGQTPLSWAKSMASNKTVSSDSARKCREIAELLEKAGANDNLQRLTRISASRNGSVWGDAMFLKGTNSFNHFTLFDLLAIHYAPAWWGPDSPAGHPGLEQVNKLPGWPFPDFAKIKINRLEKDGRTNSISVDLEAALNSGDCSKNVTLQWGDIVEIPESDHNVNETWQGLTQPIKETLRKCLGSKVAIVIKGRTNQVTLRPYFYAYGMIFLPKTAGQMPMIKGYPAETPEVAESERPKSELVSFWLYYVVQAADVLLTSSDLSRVKVRRVDPATRKPVEMVFNLEKDDSQNRLWLRDGDVIEVPEKP